MRSLSAELDRAIRSVGDAYMAREEARDNLYRREQALRDARDAAEMVRAEYTRSLQNLIGQMEIPDGNWRVDLQSGTLVKEGSDA